MSIKNRILSLWSASFVALLSLSVHAAETDINHFYLGAGIADVEPTLYEDFGGCYYYCGYSVTGSSDVGFTLTGGWRLHRFMALEVGYVHGGNPGYTDYLVYIPELLGTYDVYAEMDYQSLDLSLVGMYEWRVWDAYVKGGVAYYDAQSRQSLVHHPTGATVPRTVERDDLSYVFALGGGVRFGDGRYRLRFEYRVIPISRHLLAAPSGEASMGIADLQLQVRFGQ